MRSGQGGEFNTFVWQPVNANLLMGGVYATALMVTIVPNCRSGIEILVFIVSDRI